ncbi:MAG: xanthine dehydrogenase family protein molybdopterin-binding subunit [Magnetovibrio sp.]|nr:xanthine dehydrogenase family protein molybdopterin-binding subunit [Magnetovibrio sp.]
MPEHPPTPRSEPRLEDVRFLTGRGRYADDLGRPGQLYGHVVRSDHAHGVIQGIDASDALRVPGVVGVHTEADLAADGLNPMPCVVEVPSEPPMVVPPRTALARGRVRHVGDPVAFVVAETPAAARDAADLVAVDIDPLPAVTDARAGDGAGAPELWAEAPGNRAFRFRMGDAEAVDRAMAAAAHVIELDIANHRVTAAPMETRAGIGEYDAEAGWTLTASVQGVHGIRGQLAAVFGADMERIRVTAPDVGGGFGLKNFLYPEWVLLLWAARRHGRPVKWTAARGEDFAAATHGRDIRTRARLGLDAEGNFLALEARLHANMGAYLSSVGPGASTRAAPTAMGGVYAIPLIHMETIGVFTNTGPVDAYRGAGKPEANFIIERLIDAAARRCGFDAIELRLRNAIDTLPYRSAQGMEIDTGRFRANIVDAVGHADRAGFEARRAAAAGAGKLRGLGFGCFLETARGTPEEGAEVRFAADGRVELRVGTESNGQGHETAYAQIAGERLGLPLDAFRYIQADTRATRTGFGHGGARSMHMGGGALSAARDEVVAKARDAAAGLLQSAAADLEFAEGRFAAPSGQSVALADVAAAAAGGLDSFARIEDAPFTFPNGCHACEVEVDPDTGQVEILRYVMVDDYGALINPRLTEGQVQGGVAQGIGQALGEHVAYDPDSGQLVAGSMMDYLIPAADGLPPFELHLEGVPTEANPLGVKGSGQAGCIAAPSAVINAILDALKPLGVDHIDMPATPETVWRAIRSAG